MGWKESGLERIGWGSYPHVLLQHFLVFDEDLGKIARLALRILIIYGEVTEEFLTKRLQRFYPIGFGERERTLSAIIRIKKSLRTFYSLSITDNFKKFTLVYNIDSDGKQKVKAKELRKLHLADVEKRKRFKRIREEIKDESAQKTI